MNILALDLGTHTGWAAIQRDGDAVMVAGVRMWPHGRFESGTQTFDLQRGESPGMRYLRFDRWLAEMLAMVKPQFVVYEDAFMQPRREGTIIAYGFVTRVWAACASLGIESMPVNATRLKKWTTGDGWASKAKMLEAVNARWGLAIGAGHRCTSTSQTINRRRADKALDYCADPSHDEADAMAALRWCLETYGK